MPGGRELLDQALDRAPFRHPGRVVGTGARASGHR
jgi:hypothetical protein